MWNDEAINEWQRRIAEFVRTLDEDKACKEMEFHRGMSYLLLRGEIKQQSQHRGSEIALRGIDIPEVNGEVVFAGVVMEKTERLLTDIDAEANETKGVLQKLIKQTQGIAHIVNDLLLSETSRLRGHCETIATGVQQQFNSLREVRQFFLDTDYSAEMKDIETFIEFCGELLRLKTDGTLDAIKSKKENENEQSTWQ